MQNFTVIVVIKNDREEHLPHNLPTNWQGKTTMEVTQFVCEAVDKIIAQAPGGRLAWGADIKIN